MYSTMLGWRSPASIVASRSKRGALAIASAWRTFSATSRLSRRSRARKTVPMPPRPASARISKRPAMRSPRCIGGDGTRLPDRDLDVRALALLATARAGGQEATLDRAELAGLQVADGLAGEAKGLLEG